MFPFANMEIHFVLNGHDHVVPLSDIQTTAVIGILGLQGSGDGSALRFSVELRRRFRDGLLEDAQSDEPDGLEEISVMNLEDKIRSWRENGVVHIDTRFNPEVQDMLSIIMAANHVDCAVAAASAINEKNSRAIEETGWSVIAVHQWGHAEPNRVWNKLETPVFDISLSQEQVDFLISACRESIRCGGEGAEADGLALLLIFEMSRRGRHI